MKDLVGERLAIVAAHLRVKDLICDDRLAAALEEYALAKRLAPRQTQVLGLFLINFTRPQIAKELRLKPSTVQSYLESIVAKTREEEISAVAHAVRKGARSKREA